MPTRGVRNEKLAARKCKLATCCGWEKNYLSISRSKIGRGNWFFLISKFDFVWLWIIDVGFFESLTVIRDNWFWISLSLLYSDFLLFFFTSLNFDFSFSLTLYKTWNEHWKLIATMIYIVYKSWKISIIYTIISPSLKATKLFRIEAKNNFVSSESRRDLCTIAWTIQSASILSDTRYDSTFERLP